MIREPEQDEELNIEFLIKQLIMELNRTQKRNKLLESKVELLETKLNSLERNINDERNHKIN